MIIWDDNYISRLVEDAETDICRKVPCLYDRTALEIASGTAIYSIPPVIQQILRVTWKGIILDPLTNKELGSLNPIYRSNSGEPKWYSRIGDGQYLIRFYPVPNESIIPDGLDLFGEGINTNVIISYYRKPDTSRFECFDIPKYFDRRLVKAYVCWKCFQREGLGQNLRAALYWETKYNFLLAQFKKVIGDTYRSKHTQYRPHTMQERLRIARPQLPNSYGVKL